MSFPTAAEIREATLAEKKIELNLPLDTDPKFVEFFMAVQKAAAEGVWACVWGSVYDFPDEVKKLMYELHLYIFKIELDLPPVDFREYEPLWETCQRSETKVVISWDPTLRDYDFRGKIAGVDGDGWWVVGFV